MQFGVWLETHKLQHLHHARMVCCCTCARAGAPSISKPQQCGSDCYTIRVPIRVSQERSVRLSSNLMCDLRLHSKVFGTSCGWGASARAHLQVAFLYLRNGSADCTQILYAVLICHMQCVSVGWEPILVWKCMLIFTSGAYLCTQIIDKVTFCVLQCIAERLEDAWCMEKHEIFRPRNNAHAHTIQHLHNTEHT